MTANLGVFKWTMTANFSVYLDYDSYTLKFSNGLWMLIFVFN